MNKETLEKSIAIATWLGAEYVNDDPEGFPTGYYILDLEDFCLPMEPEDWEFHCTPNWQWLCLKKLSKDNNCSINRVFQYLGDVQNNIIFNVGNLFDAIYKYIISQNSNCKIVQPLDNLVKEIVVNGVPIIPLVSILSEITTIEKLAEVSFHHDYYRVTCTKSDGSYANLVYTNFNGFQYSITRNLSSKISDNLKPIRCNQYDLFKMLENWGFNLNYQY